METERWAVVSTNLAPELRQRFSPRCSRVVESPFCKPGMSYILNPDVVVYTEPNDWHLADVPRDGGGCPGCSQRYCVMNYVWAVLLLCSVFFVLPVAAWLYRVM